MIDQAIAERRQVADWLLPHLADGTFGSVRLILRRRGC